MGFTGSPDVFGKGGFFEALIGGENQPELLIKDFGAPYRMVSPGVGFKKYPSSYASHRSIDAALALPARHGSSHGHIERVEGVFPPLHLVVRPSTASGQIGRASRT